MWLLLKNLLFTVLGPGLVAVWIPLFVLLPRPVLLELWPSHHAIALLPVLLGVLLYTAGLWQFATDGRGTSAMIDPPKKLVTRGPYRWVRNPLYLALVLCMFGETLFYGRLVLVLYMVCLTSVLHILVVAVEEPALERRFGAHFSDYTYRVGRWWPRKPKPRLETVAPFPTGK